MRKIPSVAELRAICRKAEERYEFIPPLSKKIIRPYVAVYVTRICLLAGINGDSVTILVGLSGICGALLFLGHHPGLRVAGCVLLLTSWVLDHVDGQVLAFHQQSSAYGILLDRFSHILEHPLLHVCLGWSLGAADPRYVLLGSLNAASVLMMMAARLEAKLLTSEGHRLPRVAAGSKRRRGLNWLFRKLFGVYRGCVMIGYGPQVTVLLLLSILSGLLRPFFVFLSFSIYLNLLLTLAAILRDAYRARNQPPVLALQAGRTSTDAERV